MNRLPRCSWLVDAIIVVVADVIIVTMIVVVAAVVAMGKQRPNKVAPVLSAHMLYVSEWVNEEHM